MACFMKAETVVNLTPKKAKVMRDDPELMFKPKSYHIGAQAELILKNSSKNDPPIDVLEWCHRCLHAENCLSKS
ncbi:hypothetical protein DPMN_159676 [Dreissena polymorpha]|uniref:Uncharacterized protein n=1 Tax=Dreissena polymorpha TaxID=45954 RepID=A0A9D4EPS3_DREPO|nr:hypothetical protein DPMN_159676 [Dreissena polymorpha]